MEHYKKINAEIIEKIKELKILNSAYQAQIVSERRLRFEEHHMRVELEEILKRTAKETQQKSLELNSYLRLICGDDEVATTPTTTTTLHQPQHKEITRQSTSGEILGNFRRSLVEPPINSITSPTTQRRRSSEVGAGSCDDGGVNADGYLSTTSTISLSPSSSLAMIEDVDEKEEEGTVLQREQETIVNNGLHDISSVLEEDECTENDEEEEQSDNNDIDTNDDDGSEKAANNTKGNIALQKEIIDDAIKLRRTRNVRGMPLREISNEQTLSSTVTSSQINVKYMNANVTVRQVHCSGGKNSSLENSIDIARCLTAGTNSNATIISVNNRHMHSNDELSVDSAKHICSLYGMDRNRDGDVSWNNMKLQCSTPNAAAPTSESLQSTTTTAINSPKKLSSAVTTPKMHHSTNQRMTNNNQNQLSETQQLQNSQSRRCSAPVNYAEPKLNVKMRNNNGELFIADKKRSSSRKKR